MQNYCLPPSLPPLPPFPPSPPLPSLPQQGLNSPHLTTRDCVCLIAAIGTVLSTLPLSELVPPLESLVASRVERLQALAGEEPCSAGKTLVEKELDILGALCHHIYPELREGEGHPVMMLLIQLFPAMQMLISKWCMDHSVVEVCVHVCCVGQPH